jgi:hypothetical protein
MYVEYDEDIGEIDTSILLIPAVSGTITVAWAIGADLYVEDLDKAYLESLAQIKPVIANWHPAFSCSTKIEVKNIVSNRSEKSQIGLLFTGGVDSLASYIKHKDKKPHLIKVWGTEVRDDDLRSWKSVRTMLTEFSEKERVKIHEVRSNIPRAFNKLELYREFGLDWWQNVSHSIVLTGLCAPLTCLNNIGTLLIASSCDPYKRNYPWGSLPQIDNKISWANTRIVHDGFETDRQLKIRYFLKDYFRKYGYVSLKVCNDTRLPVSNCGKCEKCLRTITELVLEGIDPNKCGFKNVNRKTFNHIKESFVTKRFFARKRFVETRGDSIQKALELQLWQQVQKHIPEVTQIENSLYDSAGFFEWFKGFDLSEYSQQMQRNVKLSLPELLYMCANSINDRMPQKIQNPAKQFIDLCTSRYDKIGK